MPTKETFLDKKTQTEINFALSEKNTCQFHSMPNSNNNHEPVLKASVHSRINIIKLLLIMLLF